MSNGSSDYGAFACSHGTVANLRLLAVRGGLGTSLPPRPVRGTVAGFRFLYILEIGSLSHFDSVYETTMSRIARLLTGLLTASLLNAAHAAKPLVDQMPEELLGGKDRTYVNVTLENDLFGRGTDQNYTNGFRIGWFEPGRKPPGITDELEDILPFLQVNETTSVSYSLGQNLYTPDDIQNPQPDPDDRPWAAFLYGSMGMVTVYKHHLDEYEITLGVVGPLALGEPVQKTVHKIVGSPKPRGWDNQLHNEPALMMSWQRRWPNLLSLDIDDDHFFAMAPHFGFTAGNVYTYANAGATFKVASQKGRWADKPLMVRPSIPGTGFFPKTKDLYWELFLAFEGRAVGRNIFLDGNTFRDSASISKKSLVGDVSAGITLTRGRFRAGYTLVYRTREYVGQNVGDLFGAVNIGYIF